MRHILYFLALVFIILWAISFFFFMAGAIVHLLLLAAIVAIGIKIYKIRQRRKEKLKNQSIRKNTIPSILVFCSLLASHTIQSQSINLTEIVSGLEHPVGICNAGDERLFIIELGGKVQILKSGNINNEAFLDISSKVKAGGEQGLLGLAFHPNYNENGFFYVNYINLDQNTVIARFSRDAQNPDKANVSSEKLLLEIEQPFENHNGGGMTFGPDGFLYLSLGDGGGGGDPEQRAQNINDFLGKILRIDVDHGDPYAIPANNPFVNEANAKKEIWGYGLRNPWRISFDRQTGDFYIADVGQDKHEEINFEPAGSTGGKNYGWRCYEGNEPFNTANCVESSSMEFPVFEYSHDNGNCSVTGGYVYRGNKFPALQGKYIFTDFCSGQFWTLSKEGNTWNGQKTNIIEGKSITSFGEDFQGEIYAAAYDGGTIYSVSAAPVSVKEESPVSVNMYPNPAKDKIVVETSTDKILKISIYTPVGQLVQKYFPSSSNATIDLENFSGNYFILRVETAQSVFFNKVFKQ